MPSRMRDSMRMAPERWGRTGVVHAERHAGLCSHAMGEGHRREAVPPSCYPQVVCSPIEAHGVGQKGEGRGNPVQRVCVAPPHAKGGWGVCDAAPILTAPPILPCLCTSPGPCPNVGTAFSAPHSRGREGEGQCVHKTGAPALCVPQSQVRVGGTRKGLPHLPHGGH